MSESMVEHLYNIYIYIYIYIYIISQSNLKIELFIFFISFGCCLPARVLSLQAFNSMALVVISVWYVS